MTGAFRDPARILVVDDAVDAAETTANVLMLGGYDVRVAFDGKQALEVAGEARPDIVLMDIDMPRMNGYDAARALRAQPAGVGPRLLIALSANTVSGGVERALAAGFDAHLAKPLFGVDLLAALAGLMATSITADARPQGS